MVDASGDADAVEEAVIAALTPRTRLVVLSHVTFTTGAVLPVQTIAEAAHRQGALVAVDGAQAAGAIPVDVHALDIDFYAVPGQKWLCGPEGVGGPVRSQDLPHRFSPDVCRLFLAARF